MTTITEAVERYLESLAHARSPRTVRTYRSGLKVFLQALAENGLPPETSDAQLLDEGRITLLIAHLSHLSAASEVLYLAAASSFYQYLAAERLADPNLPRLQNLIRQRARKQGHRIPQFPRSAVEQLIGYAQNLDTTPLETTPETPDSASFVSRLPDRRSTEDAPPEPSKAQAAADPATPMLANRANADTSLMPVIPTAETIAADETGQTDTIGHARKGSASGPRALSPTAAALAERRRARARQREHLRNLRDRAFILFLADTGLRVSEACALTLGDVDFLEGRLTVIGKGNRQAVVRVSQRALNALRDYLAARNEPSLAAAGDPDPTGFTSQPKASSKDSTLTAPANQPPDLINHLPPAADEAMPAATPSPTLLPDGSNSLAEKSLATRKTRANHQRTTRVNQKTKSQPLFTRHDRGAPRSVQQHRLDASSAWDLVRQRAREAVGEEAAAQIHPHSFRHYFVTVVLLATNNMEKTRRLARHKSITVTQRYAEIDPELDQDYYEIFDEKG